MSLKSLFLWLLELERSRKLYQFGALPLKDFNSSLGSLTSNLFFYFHFWMWDYFRGESFFQVFEQIPYLWVKLLTLSQIKLIHLRELNYQKVPFFFVWRTNSENFRINVFDLFDFTFILSDVSWQLCKVLFPTNISVCDKTVYIFC